ncbi:MAG: hydrogenase 2 operon protein HybA [Chloroflexi bacterium]|nr:hydrogenase 2 operon protein HybA [Chloroflexota bacterium]
MNISRRTFLKAAGAGVLALSATPLFDKAAIARSLDSVGAAQVGILIDVTRCVGCRACQLACKQKNGLPPDAAKLPANRTFPEALSDTTFTLVEFHRTGGSEAKPVFATVKKQCMHCLEPACASVCPVGAITKTTRGPVLYDADKCMGCRYCMAACPFGIPKFEWDSANPRIRKCEMCNDRVEQGKQPACVEACPTGALMFGTRAELVAEAQKRVKDAPDKYVPTIYGLDEVGGTSVMYLSSVPFEKLGFNTRLPKSALPDLTWQVMEKIPAVAVGVGLLMGSISWLTHRRGAAPAETHDNAETEA